MMNKHTKIAVIIAPFLALGGYIAAGYYADTQMKKEHVLLLSSQGRCQIEQGNCILHNGQLRVNLSQTTTGITLATTHFINHAVISFVDASNKEQLYRLKKTSNPLNWKLSIHQFDAIKYTQAKKLRLLLIINKASYLAEIVLSDSLSAK